MSSTKFRVESGLQLLTRLTKKPDIENFYPNLFKSGPKQGHIIEIFSEDDVSCVLWDVICESLIPLKLGGKEAGVVIFNTDGKLNFDNVVKVLRKKLLARLDDSSQIECFLQNTLSNLFIFEIYNATQLHTTIHTLDSILINYSNISLVVFDTLTAFYWSEQGFKITKLDVYIKTLLRIIQNIVKDYKVTILYTRPQYFSSSKEQIENLESCCEYPTVEQLNYRIQIVFTDSGTHHAIVRMFDEQYKSSFKQLDDNVMWI
ncbi:DNA repair protein XRCC2 [Epargyreus clarus]|uniref:DNA repair protein XRCC2 n=1 Tax=Epargyreus clarus TaxID=520877 RepID=UPI003C30A865